MTKSLPVSKRMVYNSYLKVVAKDGGAGIDKQSIEMFNENLSGNLYKIWNRMTSGSYFPLPIYRDTDGIYSQEARRIKTTGYTKFNYGMAPTIFIVSTLTVHTRCSRSITCSL